MTSLKKGLLFEHISFYFKLEGYFLFQDARTRRLAAYCVMRHGLPGRPLWALFHISLTRISPEF